MDLSVDLYITELHLHKMIKYATLAIPNECCGFLGGSAGRVQKVYPVTNTANSPVRYHMDATEQVRSMIAIHRAGWEILGIFHSHPCGPPIPSETDLRKANYQDAAYVILCPGLKGAWQARSFRINKRQWFEVTIHSEKFGDNL